MTYVMIQDSKGNTALHLAVLYGNKEMYDLIAARDQAFEGKLRVLVRINTCANIRDVMLPNSHCYFYKL